MITGDELRNHPLTYQFGLNHYRTLYDLQFDVAYIALLNGQIVETVEVREGVCYDLDTYGGVCGIEVFEYSRHKSSDGELSSILKHSLDPMVLRAFTAVVQSKHFLNRSLMTKFSRVIRPTFCFCLGKRLLKLHERGVKILDECNCLWPTEHQ